MRIVALVKQVPDTWAERRLDLATGRVDRDAADLVVDEIDERAVSVALDLRAAAGAAELVALTMGPATAVDALRRVVALGCDRAVHVLDDGLAGADAASTAAVLAAAIRHLEGDLVLAGDRSTDGRGGVVPAMIAEHLGFPLLDGVDEVALDGEQVTGRRISEHGEASVRAGLPCVLSVTEQAAEPRFPNFRGIVAAKRKKVEVLDLTMLDVPPTGATTVTATRARPPRSEGHRIVDDGHAGHELLEFLVAERLV